MLRFWEKHAPFLGKTYSAFGEKHAPFLRRTVSVFGENSFRFGENRRSLLGNWFGFGLAWDKAQAYRF